MQATNQNQKRGKQILRIVLEPDMAMEIELRVAGRDSETEAKLWGIILADVVRHLSRACAKEYQLNPTETLDLRLEVHRAFTEELASEDPGDMAGGMVRGGPGG
jgi:Domain of unknown function (DUF5076)